METIMTKKEFQIIQEYVAAMVENGFSRCCVQVHGAACGCVNYADAERCMARVAILLDEERATETDPPKKDPEPEEGEEEKEVEFYVMQIDGSTIEIVHGRDEAIARKRSGCDVDVYGARDSDEVYGIEFLTEIDEDGNETRL